MDEQQQRALEQFYNQSSKPTVAQKEQFARMLNLSGQAVQTWFVERRARAKEDKRIEEVQARAALESAHQVSCYESVPILQARPKTHRTQSEASYASLARSLKAAAAASLPVGAAEYEPSTYSYAGSPQSYSPTNTSFEPCSSSMTRNDSQWSNLSTPAEMTEFQSFPWTQSYYMPTAQAIQNTLIYEEPIQSEAVPVEMPKVTAVRPRMQRTWTAPENFGGRQPAYRSLSMPITNENAVPESLPIRRRPKLSPLGVGMARSRSSLGYENEPVSSRRTPCSSEFPYPLTPVRRIASTTAVPTLAHMKSFTGAQERSLEQAPQLKRQEVASDADFSFGMQFPPSPISPEHSVYQQSHQNVCLDSVTLHNQSTIKEDVFTPPQTPLTALSSSAENILANNQDNIWSNNAFKMSEADFLHNELAISDIFNDDMMALESY